jgi:hypothetical protein
MNAATKNAPKNAKATAKAEHATATMDAYEGALPAPEAPAPVAEAGATAPVGATLQDEIKAESTPPPDNVASADEVMACQNGHYESAITLSKALAVAENSTMIGIGGHLQGAIDAFKPIIPKADWWRQRATTVSIFDQRHALATNGRDARSYQCINAYHLHRLVSDEAKAIILEGRDGRPFPGTTMDALARWLDYDKSDDSYTIRAGLESALDALIGAIADEGLTTAKVADAMAKAEAAQRLAKAEATGSAEATAKAKATNKAKSTADRVKAIAKATETFAKAIGADKIGGASASEILHHLSAQGLAEATGLIDPATMSPTDALAFAQRLCELDRADVIFVILQRLRAYETSAMAKQSAKAPAPTLDDTPKAKATASAAA